MIRRRHGPGFDAGKTVQKPQTLVGAEGEHGLALRVDVGQFRSKLLEHGHCGRLVIDEDPSLATGGDFTAQDQILIAAVNAILFQNFSNGAALSIEDCGDHSFFRAMADHFIGSAFAQQQRQRVNQNGFAGAGFTCQQV